MSGETVARMLGALLPSGWRARVEDADAGACLHADRVILERRDVDREWEEVAWGLAVSDLHTAAAAELGQTVVHLAGEVEIPPLGEPLDTTYAARGLL